MQRQRFAIFFTALIVSGALAGCSGGSGMSSSANGSGAAASSKGTLSVGLIDAPVRDATKICLDITEVDVQPTDGDMIQFPLDPPVRKDLLQLTPDNSATLLDSVSVPAGQYDWVQLKVNADFNSSGNATASDDCPSTTYDSYVDTASGGEYALRVPSGKVRLVSGFTITADQHTSFKIDWNARKGLVNPVGLPGYMLRPALRIVDMTQHGTLEGTIAMTTVTNADNSCNADDPTNQNYDVGNVVYIFSGHDATPNDITGTDTDPVATADAEPNADKTAYTYKTLLSPGDYTVAFTCQAANDDPQTDEPNTNDPSAMNPVTFLTPTNNMMSGNITIDAGGDVEIDF